jgi:aspartoacylase
VHRHRGSLDLPRHPDGSPAALVHPHLQHRDWRPLRDGEPLFWCADGTVIAYDPALAPDPAARWPVFINEAAYGEKGIALSLCVRERWPCEPGWVEALAAL